MVTILVYHTGKLAVGLGFAMVGFGFYGFTLNLRGMAMWHVIGSIAALSCRCEQL